jgi:hypothetical protein
MQTRPTPGIASAVNNAVARVASLIGVSVVGIVVAGTLLGDTFAANSESVRAFHQVIAICVGLLAAGGHAGRNRQPRRHVSARGCGRAASPERQKPQRRPDARRRPPVRRDDPVVLDHEAPRLRDQAHWTHPQPAWDCR